MRELVLPRLTKLALKEQSAEFTRRVQQIIKDPTSIKTHEFLAEIRALEVLERIGGAKSRELLLTLAGGAPEVRLTADARSTLDRLQAREQERP
jgi:hypothetical protein